MTKSTDIYQTVILGSGPAGYTAAIYACRAGLKPLLITGEQVGGQLTSTPEIANWPGRFDVPNGTDLMGSLEKHANTLGAEFLFDIAVDVDFSCENKVITLASGKKIETKTLIICTGAHTKYLNLPSEYKYRGKGVSACATCDGFFFKDKEVAVVGGGSSAFVEALYLSSICKKVYLIHRRDSFRAENTLVKRLTNLQKDGKVEFILNANVDEVIGDGNKVTAISVVSKFGKRKIDLSGVFIAIGHETNSKIFEGKLELGEDGIIKVGFGSQTQTSVKGVFAAGDCADNIYRQAITSAGMGCMAALDAEKYLQEQL